jgi:hypothetical protein
MLEKEWKCLDALVKFPLMTFSLQDVSERERVSLERIKNYLSSSPGLPDVLSLFSAVFVSAGGYSDVRFYVVVQI